MLVACVSFAVEVNGISGDVGPMLEDSCFFLCCQGKGGWDLGRTLTEEARGAPASVKRHGLLHGVR